MPTWQLYVEGLSTSSCTCLTLSWFSGKTIQTHLSSYLLWVKKKIVSFSCWFILHSLYFINLIKKSCYWKMYALLSGLMIDWSWLMGRMIIGYIDLLMMIDDNTVKHRLFSLFHLIVSKEILNEKPKEKEYSLRWWCLACSGDSRLPSVLTVLCCQEDQNIQRYI